MMKYYHLLNLIYFPTICNAKLFIRYYRTVLTGKIDFFCECQNSMAMQNSELTLQMYCR